MAPNLVNRLLYEPENSGILWIKFNRPERMNALIESSEENGTLAKLGKYMRAALDSPLETTMVMTSNAGGILNSAEDAVEARRAFLEKRKTAFKGR